MLLNKCKNVAAIRSEPSSELRGSTIITLVRLNLRPDRRERHALNIRVSHNTPFFELSLVLLTTHAIGLEEATKNYNTESVRLNLRPDRRERRALNPEIYFGMHGL